MFCKQLSYTLSIPSTRAQDMTLTERQIETKDPQLSMEKHMVIGRPIEMYLPHSSPKFWKSPKKTILSLSLMRQKRNFNKSHANIQRKIRFAVNITNL